MNSRDKILRTLRSQLVQAVEPPDLQQDWQRFDDPLGQFQASLQIVGGQSLLAADSQSAARQIAELPTVQAATRICSLRPDLLTGNVDLDGVDDPHAVHDVDLTLVEGRWGVAENGAIWLTEEGLRQRSVLFLTQHLIIVLAADAVVNNMHEAYDRIGNLPTGYGVFISGPSKTADIEQSLVIGAHGARSLTVVLLES